MTDLISRLEQAAPEDFPYADVVAELMRVGKHFAPKSLLAALHAVRRRLPAEHDGGPAATELARFLDCVLDKWDGKYDYSTYTAITLLPLPSGPDPADAARVRDRLLLLLIADMLRFELAAEKGQTALLPRMRPEPAVVAKRCRLGLRPLTAQFGSLGLTPADLAADPRAAAWQVWLAVKPGLSVSERRMLLLSMLPVDIIHDEHMFIRVLQSFETTFALLVVQLEAVIRIVSGLVDDGKPPCGQEPAEIMRAAATALHGAAPLFSLLATMQVDAFRLFRQFTEGASAIQSRGYKTMEALCRRPDPERLDSAAYRFVPEVRHLVLSGLPELQTTVSRACAAGVLPAATAQELVAAMNSFAAVLSQWRTTHYRLAVRMLGTAPGTGYTEGTPYLKGVLNIPVFTADDTKEGFS